MPQQPGIENWRNLMIRAVETDDYILFLAAQVCAYNLRLVEGLNDDEQK